MAAKTGTRASNNPTGRPRSDELTLRLQSAALSLLHEHGYRGLSMDAVAQRAGASRPALYRRYADIAELTLDAVEQVGEEAAVMMYSGDLVKDLTVYLAAVVVALNSESLGGRAFRGLLSEALVNPQFQISFARLIERRRAPVAARLKSDSPSLQPGEVDCVLDSLFGPILYRLLVRGLPVSKAMVQGCVEAALQSADRRSLGPRDLAGGP